VTAASFGLFLNCGGEVVERSHTEVFETALAEAELADRLGFHDVWVTEHHFIPFGVNPSALALASFLLGRTRRLRVGTAVTLAPLYHPLQLAEQAALLDQLSSGRFDFGIGRGGYLRDFIEFGIDVARWDREVETTLDALAAAWSPGSTLMPRPLTQPHPPLYVASATPGSVERAAQRGAPLLHYFATPLEARAHVEAAYRAAAERAGRDASGVAHVHALIVVVSDDERSARERLRESLGRSFAAGDHPHVPQSEKRHLGLDGRPLERNAMADFAARGALVGSPAQLAEAFGRLRDEHGVRRFVLYMEPVVDRCELLEGIERFAKEVTPALGRES
jgi:alkanesulfonate monooxygenase SsuD/methylene tetrahydromethanopterin reductase-like flavin-dependent oxidoreductase (luciferase family)